VKASLNSWKVHNPGWQINTITLESLREFLNVNEIFQDILVEQTPPEAISDVIRIHLLRTYGGVWVDATTYCLCPLDQWLSDNTPVGFFAFSNPGPDRLLSSWFLAAAKGNYMVEKWCEATQQYWKGRKAPHTYFWFHNLFADCYHSDVQFKDYWDKSPTISAAGPHYFSPPEIRLDAQPTIDDLSFIDGPAVPLIKLSHKLNGPHPEPGSVLELLITRAHEGHIKLQDQCSSAAFSAESKNQRLLIVWYGSIKGHGTIGDLLSLQSVASHLVGMGHRVLHASAEPWHIPGSTRVEFACVSFDELDGVIFTCGPMLRHHPETQALFKQFEHLRKIGIGVSILPAENDNFYDPFDQVLAREGKYPAYEDVAIIAPPNSLIGDVPSMTNQQLVIGLCLRGLQLEYGLERCAWERVEGTALRTAKHLTQKRGARVIHIENHLARSNKSPAEIEALYKSCNLIITSRFHGAMLALRHGVPFIAIDQIVGGAKVSNLVGATEWPFVYKMESLDDEETIAAAEALLGSTHQGQLFEIRERVIARANQTMTKLDQILRFDISR
jgi:hypothetical protein